MTRPTPDTGDPTPTLSPDDLLAGLHAQGIEAELIAPGVPMPTVPLAAAAIGVREEQILKSLLFIDAAARLVLVIASGTGRIDRARLAQVAGLHKPKMADPATVLAATGYPAGGVPPVGHRTPLRVLLDRRAAALDLAWAGGGAEDLLLRIRPHDIIRLTGAEVVDVVVDQHLA